MKLITVNNYEELSRRAADIIAAQVSSKPSSVLGLATGSSPLGTYKILAEMYERGELDFGNITTVNLDEYAGLDGESPQSYRYFMEENLFSRINIDKKNTYIPDGCAANIGDEGRRYDELIKSLGGIDLQLLGIGYDGHIGFNEPGEFFVKESHLVELDESTIDANSRFFSSREDVPRYAVTMGMMSIMSAKRILLIASGEKKWEVLKKAMYGPVSPKIPASILQLHSDVTVIYSKE